jgi:hypothetical protein
LLLAEGLQVSVNTASDNRHGQDEQQQTSQAELTPAPPAFGGVC